MRFGRVFLRGFSLLAIVGLILAGWLQTQVQAKTSTGLSAMSAAPGATPVNDFFYWLNPLPNGNTIYAIACPSATTCYTAGSRGSVAVSNDSGETWLPLPTGTNADFKSITCPTTLRCIAVGLNAAVYLTMDGGFSWSARNPGVTDDLYGVACATATTCFTVGGFHIIPSHDGGLTWDTALTFLARKIVQVSCPDQLICYASDILPNSTYLVLKTIDGGQNWSPVPSLSGFTSLSCPSVKLCVGANLFYIERTNDGGQTWGDRTTFPGVQFQNVTCPDTIHCFAVGINTPAPGQPKLGSVFASTNGGATFNPVNPSFNEYFFTISCPGANTCIAGMASGKIYKTNNGGTNWTNRTVSKQSIGRVSCADGLHCVGAGQVEGVPKVFNTSDGGADWKSYPAPSIQITRLKCFTVTDCLAVAYSGEAFTTTNGGQSWLTHNTGLTNIFELSCAGSNTCYLVAGNGAMAKSIDGGQSWSPLNSPITTNPLTLTCPTVQVCYMRTSAVNVTILKTTNGGQSWAPTLTTPFVFDPQKFSCPSASICYAIGFENTGYPNIVATFNGGDTWSYQLPSNNRPGFHDITCQNTNICYAVGENGFILATNDSGTTWTPQNSSTYDALFTVVCPENCLLIDASDHLLTNRSPYQYVTKSSDDGSPGSLSAALTQAQPGQSILLNIAGGTLNLGPAGINLKAGVNLIGSCSAPTILNANHQAGAKLILNGHSLVQGLKLTNLNGQGIKATGNGNQLRCVKT